MSGKIDWIKINTDMFDNKKIKIIESFPDADTLIVIWVKLICEAGKLNADGWIFLSANLPYTLEELAIALDRPVNTVKLALSTFERLQMITFDEEKGVLLNNFADIQNTEGMKKIREGNRERQARLRERRKLALPEANVEEILNTPSGSVTRDVTLSNATDKIRLDNIREEQKNLNEIWDSVLQTLKTGMNQSNYRLLEKEVSLHSITDEKIELVTKDESQAEHIERQLKMLIETAFHKAGIEDRKLEVCLIER